MRRTDEEFKAEVFRRSEAFRTRQKRRRKKVTAVCLPVLLCSTALLWVFFSGAGAGSTASADCAAPEEFAAYQNESAFEGENPKDAAVEEPEPSMESQVTSGTGTAEAAVIEVITQATSSEYGRTFTAPEKTGGILEAIQAFYDDPETFCRDSEIGEDDGTGSRITVTQGTETAVFYLRGDALVMLDSDGTCLMCLVNENAARVLEALISQNGD